MGLARLVLDTSAYSHLKRGHVGVIERVAEARIVLVPVTVLGELEAGFRLGSRHAENQRALARFLEEPFVQTLDVTDSVAAKYGEVFANLRRIGRPLPINDVWIAAATLALDGHLLTFDADFQHVQGLAATLLS